ncbi:MAG: sulfotransferase [Hyphomonadaceae bacterium]
MLGVIAADHQNHGQAVELYDRAISLSPRFAQAFAQKARSLLALHQRSEAVSAADSAAAAAPEDGYTLNTIGVVYSRAGLHARAIPFYRQVAERAPSAAHFYNLAAALQFMGEMDEARAAYRETLKLDPSHGHAWSGLVQITRQTPEANEIDSLLGVFDPENANPDETLNIGHALAKAYEDLGRDAEAMSCLARAKAPKRASLKASTDFDNRLFDAAERTASLPGSGGLAGPSPIFIVGMPRTGTTLVDRILSSHSECASAGELTDFSMALKRRTGTKTPHVLDPETLEASATVEPAAVGQDYLESVRTSLGLTGRFIDKMPLNAFLAPNILRALPDARVICLRRHPADAVLSNYRQLFATSFGYYAYAYHLEDTARYYVRFDRMIARFRETLPADRFIEVHYEKVVDDLEGETRRLLEFCDLPFEAACLTFHQNAAPVATASAAQVRKPLYRTSLDRWRRCRPAIDPALRILIDEGCMTVEELASAD